MWDHVFSRANRRKKHKALPVRSWPVLETLEGRLVLDAALASLPDISAPQFQGYQVVLDGSASNAPQQTFTVTSSNPDIKATVAQGQFLTMNVTHQSSGPGDLAFSGNIVFQLFEDLTPNTAATIEGFVTSGFYNNKDLFRVANGFPDANGYIIQGGSPNNLDTGVSGLPGTPFPNEIVPQLAFTNPGQLAMANTGQPDSNDTQFFITTAAPSFLDGGYTIFGQVVSGLDLVNEMTQVALTSDPVNTQFDSYPVSPIVVNSETLSSFNPDGVLHIDTTQAQIDETSTITVTAHDPTTNTSQTQSFMVTVAANPPTANPQSLSTPQDIAVPVTLTGSDPDTPPLPLTYSVTTEPAHGTLLGTAPNLTYTPDPGYFGSDSFQFTDNNGTATSAPATVVISVIGPPTANAQSLNTPDESAPITLTGSDPNSPPLPLTYSVTVPPTHGILTGTAPDLTYTPDFGYIGSDSFQFTVSNESFTSAPATVALTVFDQPVADAQSVATAEGTAALIELTGFDPLVPVTYTVTAGPAHGTLTGTAPDVTYTPDPGYIGSDSFQFTDSNGTLTSAAATVTIAVVGQPTANAQSLTAAEDAPTPVVLTGSDPDVPPLALTYFLTTDPAHGTVSGLAPDLLYTPDSGYTGPDSFQFTASNGTLTSAPATVALTVVDQPTAIAQSVTVAEGAPTAITLTGSDPNTPPLALTYSISTNPAHGTLSGTAPNIVYTPDSGYSGPDSFQFTDNDGIATSNPGTVALTVVAAPTANAQSVSSVPGVLTFVTLTGSDPDQLQPLTYSVTTSPTHGTLGGTLPFLVYTPDPGYFGSDSFQFTDGNGTATSAPATVSITVVGQPTANAQSVTTAQDKPTAITLTGTDPDTPPLALTYSVNTGPTHGTLSGTAPNITYTPFTGYVGPDSFQFTDSDGIVTSTPVFVVLTVVAQPTANAQSVTTTEGAPKAITLTGSDPNTPPLSLTYTVTAGPANGTLSGTAPDLTYTPDSGYSGTDSFQFTDTNGTATSAPVTVALTVIGQPTAVALSATTAEGTTRAITLAGTDPDSPPLALTYTVTAGPAHGTLSGTAPDLSYTPDAGYFGSDSFQYTDTNGVVTSAPATVALTVVQTTAVGQPTANAQSVTTAQGTPTAITLTGTDPDTPPLALTYSVNPGPAHGTLSGTAPNLTYTPTSGYFGPDSFQFTDSNGTLTSAPATVALTVVGQPTANAQSVTTTAGAPTAITLTGSDPNTPPLPLTYAVTTGPAHGTLSGTAPNLTYTPVSGYSGSDSFQFTVTNSSSETKVTSSPATVNLTIAAAPPTAAPVTIKSVQWQVTKVHGKKSRMVLVVSFSGAPDLGTAENVNNYHLIAAGRDEKFGTRDDKNLKLQAPVYNASTQTVTLTPQGTVPNQMLKLTISVTQTTSAVGRPSNGRFFQLSSV